MVIPSEIREAVEFIDKHEPEWWKKIDLNILQMCDYEFCVLGQLYRSTKTYCEIRMWLNSNSLVTQFANYDDKWKELIMYRRQSDSKPLSFGQVLALALPYNKPIRFGGWSRKDAYWRYDSNNDFFVWDDSDVGCGSRVHLDNTTNLYDIQKLGWEVYSEPKKRLKDVKPGQKFYYKGDNPTNGYYTSLNKNTHISKYEYIYVCDNRLGGNNNGDDEVVIVE